MPRPTNKSLSLEEFSALLRWLDRDPERAGDVYAALHAKITAMFRRHGIPFAEELADDVFNRIARRLVASDSDREILTTQPANFILGVARTIITYEKGRGLQGWQSQKEQPLEVMEIADPGSSRIEEGLIMAQEDGVRAACLEKCLARLSADDRALLEAYYACEGGGRGQLHREMAGKFGVSESGLRSRIARIKEKLGICVRKCASRR